jgi:hypothetical protein
MIKPGTSSSPTDLEGFSLLMALQTSASDRGARDKISEDNNNNNNSVQFNCYLFRC